MSPILPAPDWATATQPVTTSGNLPVEVRESLSSLSSWLAGVPADGDDRKTLYEVDSLALLASAAPPSSMSGGGESPMGAMLTARFQAQPFTEPLTRHNYVRARWYDPDTGTWLSPDPIGYRDSSNLYAFAGGDPVNCADPTGQAASVTKTGLVVGRRPDGTSYRIEPGADSAEMMRILETDADVGSEEREEIIETALRRGPGSISAMRGSPGPGAFWWAVDTATVGFFSMPGGNYSPLREDEPVQASLDLRTFKREYPKTIFVADAAQALTAKGWAVKAMGIVGAGLGLADNLGRSKPLQPGESGRFSDLDRRGVTGDDLTPHHMPQAAAGFTSREEGGALVMEHGEHIQTRTYFSKGRAVARAEAGMSFRDVLARDIRDVRKIVGTEYDEGILHLLKYYRKYFPELMEKVAKVAK